MTIYCRHRFTHIYMWRFHSIHHNAQDISWSTKFRLHPVDFLTASVFNILFLYFIGFSGEGIIISSTIITIVDYWNHCNYDFGFKGFMRFILSSPKYHRWHHAVEKAAVNKNFVVCYPFIDIIFGTYYYPAERYPNKYGLFKKEQQAVPKNIIGQFLHPFKQKRKS